MPVSGYDELDASSAELAGPDTDIHSIFLVDCGGVISVEDDLDLNDHVTVYIRTVGGVLGGVRGGSAWKCPSLVIVCLTISPKHQ